MISINLSVSVCQLATCKSSSFGKSLLISMLFETHYHIGRFWLFLICQGRVLYLALEQLFKHRKEKKETFLSSGSYCVKYKSRLSCFYNIVSRYCQTKGKHYVCLDNSHSLTTYLMPFCTFRFESWVTFGTFCFS